MSFGDAMINIHMKKMREENDDKSAHARRSALKTFAMVQLKAQPNRCQSFVDIVGLATRLVENVNYPARAMVSDLQAVLIGSGLLRGRGSGPYFAGQVRGAEGFKRNLRDPYNQVQHAMAGIAIGFGYNRLVQWYVWYLEEEAQDDRLYDATIPLGRTLTDGNYKQLAGKLRGAIGDYSCQVPAP